jgi:hypothetical protein
MGTWVHSQFDQEIKSRGYQGNTILGGIFGSDRPDAIDENNNLVWELKPATCEKGIGNNAARKQLRDYVASANRNRPLGSQEWQIGVSNLLFRNPITIERTYNGSKYNITFYADPNDNTSGLIFYKLDGESPCGCPVN